jgi:hypothetical protein
MIRGSSLGESDLESTALEPLACSGTHVSLMVRSHACDRKKNEPISRRGHVCESFPVTGTPQC